MEIAAWSAVVGLLLIVMALGDSLLARLPLSTSMLYLAVGAAVSPLWLGWTSLAAGTQTKALEQLAEIVVLLSLFGSGLKMSAGLSDGRWLLPLRLADPVDAGDGGAGRRRRRARARPAARRRDPARRHPRADRPGARLRRAGRRARRPRPASLRPHRRGRPQRRHGLSAGACSASACSGCTTSAASAGAGSRSTCSGR